MDSRCTTFLLVSDEKFFPPRKLLESSAQSSDVRITENPLQASTLWPLSGGSWVDRNLSPILCPRPWQYGLQGVYVTCSTPLRAAETKGISIIVASAL